MSHKIEPKKYIRKFTIIEKNKLNMIERNNVRLKAMSIYSYIKKLIEENLNHISIERFIERFKRYHFNLSKSTLFEYLERLKSLDLITIKKLENKNLFSLFSGEKESIKNEDVKILHEQKPNEKPNEKKISTSVDIQGIEKNLYLPKYKILNNTNTNTLYNTKTEENIAPIELVNIAKNIMKETGITSKVIVNMVVSKLRSCENINKSGMIKYIEKVIIEKVNKHNQVRANINSFFAKKHYAKSNKKPEILDFTNYSQREYDYDDLEKQLLGW